MKKLALALFVALFSAGLFTGCEKEVVSTALVVDTTQTAQVKIYFNVQTDASALDPEPVPDGITVIFSVIRDQLNPNATGTGRWSTTTVTTDGYAIAEVPANSEGITVYIKLNAFEFDYLTLGSETVTHYAYYSGGISGIVTDGFSITSVNLTSYPL